MKIIILCGFLQQGSCGVGDYSRRLAGELIRQGHELGIIALNDKFVDLEDEGFQKSDSISIPVLRLPSLMPERERFSRAKTWINNFNPEWLSFQFEPFSFNNKGLPFRLSRLIFDLGENRRWQVMFHELWLGLEKQASTKILLWGVIQRILIQNLVKKLNPAVIHTQCQIHMYALAKLNIRAQLLPLISNIPVSTSKILNILKSRDIKRVSFVIFGSIYYGAPIAEFAKEAGLFARQNEVEFTIISVGRNRRMSSDWVTICRNEGLIVSILGQQTEERISEIFSNATFGISTTPYILSEKSGTVMAMREHGLPVICVARPFSLRNKVAIKPLTGVTEYLEGSLAKCLDVHRSVAEIKNIVSEVSCQFINSLSST